MHLHEYTNEFHTRCLVYFPRRSHIILTQIYPFLEEYWKANSITCIVAIMVLTDTSDEECTIAKLKTYALECTYCAIRIAVPSYPYALVLSINYMPKFTRLVKTAQQDFHR
jgi:hypothetical protein